MLGDLQTRLWDIEHLALFNARHHRRRQRAMTGAAAPRFVLFDEVRRQRLAKGIALVADLAAASLCRFAAQATRHRRLLLQPVAGRRFTAVAAVLGQLSAEL